MQQNGVDKNITLQWPKPMGYMKSTPRVKQSYQRFVDRYKVPRGLKKKEYKELLKEIQGHLDKLKEDIRCFGALSPTGMFLTFRQEEYVRMKKTIKSVLKLHKKWGTNNINATIAKAKQFPIEQLLEFNYAGSRECIFHKENTPSMKLYKEQNRVHCFGACAKGFDAIDVYREINNVDLITAIKALS